HVRGGGADHDQVDLLGQDAGRLDRLQRGLVAQVAGGLPFGGHPALADTSTRTDPLVAGIDHLGQVVIGNHLLRQVAAGSGDARIDPLAHAYSRREGSRGSRRFATSRTDAGRPSGSGSQSSSTTEVLVAMTFLPR